MEKASEEKASFMIAAVSNMDVVSAVVRCAEGFGKPGQLSVIRILFAFSYAQRDKLLVKSVDPQYGYISSSSQVVENPSACESWPPRPAFNLP